MEIPQRLIQPSHVRRAAGAPVGGRGWGSRCGGMPGFPVEEKERDGEHGLRDGDHAVGQYLDDEMVRGARQGRERHGEREDGREEKAGRPEDGQAAAGRERVAGAERGAEGRAVDHHEGVHESEPDQDDHAGHDERDQHQPCYEEPRPRHQAVDQDPGVARGLATLDARQGRQRRGHHQRTEDTLHHEPDAEAAGGGVGCALRGREEIDVVDHQMAREPHGQRDEREQFEVMRENPERPLENVPAHYLTWEPGGTSLSSVRRDTVPSWESASTMPLDSTPMRVTDWRFATMTTLRPTSDPGSYCSAMPATTVRVSSPTLTVSLRSFFDFGRRSAASTSATRSSTLAKSSMGIRAAPAAAPSPCPFP